MPSCRSALVVAVTACLMMLVGGCGGPGRDDGRFNAGEETGPLPCLHHQEQSPGRAYTAGPDADTAAIFTMLRYYTTNKATTRFCDGEGPTDTDRQWARLYVDLGAEENNVTHLLG